MNGVDFTLREVSRFGDEPGAIDFDNSERRTPETVPRPSPTADGWWTLGARSLLGRLQRDRQHARPTCSGWPAPARALLRSGAHIEHRAVGLGLFGPKRLGPRRPQPRRPAPETQRPSVAARLSTELDAPAAKTYAGQATRTRTSDQSSVISHQSSVGSASCCCRPIVEVGQRPTANEPDKLPPGFGVSLEAGTRLGSYEITSRRLESGAMGEVYRRRKI